MLVAPGMEAAAQWSPSKRPVRETFVSPGRDNGTEGVALLSTPPTPGARPMTAAPLVDRVARRIAAALQRDGRQSAQQLAESVGLSATPVWRRVKELEASGVIRGYVALLDREKLGLSICVLAHVTLLRHTEGAVEHF